MNEVRLSLYFEFTRLLKDASNSGLKTDIVLLPELMDVDYKGVYGGTPPHRLGDSLFQDLQTLTRKQPVTIVAGSIFFASDYGNTNSSFVFHKGEVIHRYDKIHLFKPCKDNEYFQRGRNARTFRFETSGVDVTAGSVICYDLRFPELIRYLSTQGIQILFVPARWPAERDDAWKTLLKARAIENQIFVAGCNSADAEGGNSYVFSPLGEMLFDSTKAGAPETITIDFEQLHSAKAVHHNLEDAQLLKDQKLTFRNS